MTGHFLTKATLAPGTRSIGALLAETAASTEAIACFGASFQAPRKGHRSAISFIVGSMIATI